MKQNSIRYLDTHFDSFKPHTTTKTNTETVPEYIHSMDTDLPECVVCFKHAMMSSLNGCTHKFCMNCAVQHSTYNKERGALCPICRRQYTMVTQDNNKLTFNVSGKFKVPDFPWVSAFCMGLANNIRLSVTGEKINMVIPELLTNMIGCKSTVYWVITANGCSFTENGDMSDDLQPRFHAMGVAVSAWVFLPDIYPKLVIAKHVERMVKDRLMKKYPMPPHITVESDLSDLRSYDIRGVGLPPS